MTEYGKEKQNRDRRETAAFLVLWLLLVLIPLAYLIKSEFPFHNILVFLCVALLALFVHLRRMKRQQSKGKNYLRYLLGLDAAVRDRRLDLIRFAATAMVIVTHVLQLAVGNGVIVSEPGVTVTRYIAYVCLACNVLFVMLSGSLLFPWKEEGILEFYLHRGLRVVIPLIIYYIYYTFQNRLWDEPSGQNVLDLLKSLYTGESDIAPHFWLIYVILGVYLAVPFFRYMFRNMPYRVLSVLVVLILIFMLFRVNLYNLLAVRPFFAEWIGVAVIGYWLRREETRKFDKFLAAAGAAAVVILFFLVRKGDMDPFYYTNCAPVMVVTAMGVWALVFLLCGNKERKQPGVFFRIFNKFSFSILLVHWAVITYVVQALFRLEVTSFGGLGFVLVPVLTFAASLFVAIVVDILVTDLLTDLKKV